MSQKNNSLQEENHIKDILFPYLKKWKFYILSLIVAFGIYKVYLRYAKQTYKVNATIIVKDDKKDGFSNQLSAFENLGFNVSGGASRIENEIDLLQSRSLVSSVVKVLKLNIAYFDLKTPQKQELFDKLPIKINFLDGDSSIYNKNAVIEIKKQDDATFELYDLKTKSKNTYHFGKRIKTAFGNIIITPTSSVKIKDFNIKITLSKFDNVVSNIKNSIIVEQLKEESSLLTVTTKTFNIDKGKAILKELIKQHTNDVVTDKNEVSKNTLEFINERINFITDELSDVEENVSTFKSKNKIFDLATNATMFFENENMNEKLLAENSIQLKITEFILDHLKNAKNNDLLPYNVGLSNVAIDNLISNVNNIILERNKLLARSNENNPIVLNLENQISSIKNNLKESLINEKKSLKIKNKELEKSNNILNQKLTSAPKQEKVFREIARQQQIKETLYLFLLQKREETAISLAVSASNIKVIDEPYSDGNVVAPKKQILFLLTLFLSILIPSVIIYLLNLLNTKVTSKLSILNSNLPYLGDIPLLKKFNDTNKVIITANSNDSISESFRILRTNIDFLFKKKDLNTKVLFVTSTIEKEGKSFVSLNLANSLALTNKKVMLIGMDLRAPKLLDYLGLQNRKGITNYIIDESIDYNDLIIKNHNGLSFDILPSGDIPPNPTELLLNERVGELFYKLRNKYEFTDQYDYVIVDTAPVAPVADTLLITQHSDAIIYVCRANYLDENLLKIPASLYAEDKLPNLAVVLNGTDQKNGYGYGYGYGYGDLLKKDLPWYKKIFTS